MPKKCLICRAEPSPICKRSFHMFPKNASIKQKWLSAINVSKIPNFKTAYVCSDHFDAESFFYCDEMRQRKRLCKEAIPKQENINSLDLLRENETKDTSMIDIVKHEINDATEDETLKANTNENVMCKVNLTLGNYLELHNINVLEDASSQSHLIKEVEIGTNEVFSITSIKTEEIDVSEDINLQSGSETVNETYTQDLPFNNSETLNDNTSSRKTNRKKRKGSLGNIKTVKKLRFMNGFKTEYVCQQDFVSEEAWNRFLRFSAYQKSRTAAAHNKNSRKKRKIKILNDMINVLTKGEVLD